MDSKYKQKKRANKLLDEIIKEVAKQHGLPVEQIREVLNHTYGFIINKIREGKLEGIRITHLGSFVVKPFKRKKFLERKLKESEQKTDENKGN